MTYFDLTDAERYRIAAFWTLVSAFEGLAFGHYSGLYPPWVGALVWGFGGLIGGAITITWAHRRASRCAAKRDRFEPPPR